MSAAPPRAIEPIFDSPPHLIDPSGKVAVWYTEPPGVVLQLREPMDGTVELARWVTEGTSAELRRRHTEHGDLFVVFDVRLLTGRDPEARRIVVEHAKTMHKRIQRTLVVAPRSFSPALMRTMHVTLSILRVFGVNVEIAPSPTYFLAETKLRPMA